MKMLWTQACKSLEKVLTTCVRIYTEKGLEPADLWMYVVIFAERKFEEATK